MLCLLSIDLFSIFSQCAVLGGKLPLLKWLVDENCCPLKSIRVGCGGRKGTNDSYTPILTSKSRSLLHIALSNNFIDIVRYLVVEKGMVLREERYLPIEILVQNFDLVLRLLPTEAANQQPHDGMYDELQRSDSPPNNNTNNPTTINSTEMSSSSTHGSMDGTMAVVTAANPEPRENPEVTHDEDVGNKFDQVAL